MKPLARSAVVWVLCAAILAAQWPASAWAAAAAEPTPAEALQLFRELGIYKDDADTVKSYLVSGGKLTPIALIMYRSLLARYNPSEEVEGMKPLLDRMRANGPYNESRQDGAARAMKVFEQKFGALAASQAGSVEESFQLGGQREAAMSGAAVADPPRAGAYKQYTVADGYKFFDSKGLAFIMTKNQVTTYNRELQKNQRLMNLNRPPQVAAIPETGRYNFEMLQYSYWRIKNQETEYINATRIDRMIAIAELLGKQFPTDLWFNKPGLEEQLIRQAKDKTYEHRGETYSVYEIVEAKFTRRREYIEGAKAAVLRFETDMNQFKESKTITDSQVATMSLDEANALRWLSLTVLETQMFHVKNQGERVDPTSPDAQAIMKIVDESDMTQEQKVRYKAQGTAMKKRLDDLQAILNKTRQALSDADYAGSLDSVQAALAATQKELGDLSVDYSIYLEAPSTAFLAKGQTLKKHSAFNVFGHLYNGLSTTLRGGYKLFGSEYKESMKAIEGADGAPSMAQAYTEIAGLIASGRREDWVKARGRIMAMNPNASRYEMSGTPGADAPKVNDALRISASLRANHERITAVTEVNKTLDAASTFATYAVSIALMAPVARASLNGIGKLSGVGAGMIQKSMAAGTTMFAPSRMFGRTLMFVGEIAKHSAARLQSLEPSAGRVNAVAGDSAVAQYLVASGARALSVAARQGTFTTLSGFISAGFTAGAHLVDVGAEKIGGVRIPERVYVVGGWEPGNSMFSSDLAGLGRAATAGFKGGAWWANESFHPLLGYIGLPSTVFGGTRLAQAMDIVGTRGVVGSASHGFRVWKNGSAAVEAAAEAAAASGRMGFLERLAESKWKIANVGGFGLSMADNVAKYALFSKFAGFVGREYSWGVETNVPILSPLVTNSETDVERRIKRSLHAGNVALESPAWLLIPTHSAHGARDAGPYMNVKEGMRQYDAAGETFKYANAPIDKPLSLKPVKPPVSQRLFEARFFGERPSSEWIVTKQAKEAGQRKEVRRLANEDGLVNPLELMAVRNLKAGEDTFRTLKVTEEVQKATYDVAIEGYVAQPTKSLEALSVQPGRTVKGWGEITPEIQIEVAKTLYHAENNLGRKLTPELSLKVREVLKDHLLANLPVGEAFKAVRAAVVALPVKSVKLDKAQMEAVETVLDWEAALPHVDRLKQKVKDGVPLSAKEAEILALGNQSYAELTVALRKAAEAKLQAGELLPGEAKALDALYEGILAGDRRFNAFNRADYVRDRSEVIFNALKIKYANRPEMLKTIEVYRKEVRDWAVRRKGQTANDDAASTEKLSTLITRLDAELKLKIEASAKSAALGKLFGPSEGAALKDALQAVNNSAWVVRDAKGGAIPGWRPKQFVRLMQSFLGEGGHTKAVRSASEGLVDAVRAEHKGSAKMQSSVDGIEADVQAWVKAREAAPESEIAMSGLIEKLEVRLKNAPAELTLKEGLTLNSLVDSIAELDRAGLHKGILDSGRAKGKVQLFVKAPTSLGKTLLAYEGLLPYLEAEAAASGRKVMFLTFNTKLQAQAEFDFIAFNKLGSTVKFETYEGLKTMIAEGKTKGRNIVEDYLSLQDEMDAAGQQPALTIGMVSGRVSRLSGQTAALNDSNAGLAWGLSRLNTIRVEAAEVQAQRIKSVTAGISDAHVERGQLGKIKVAADDVLTAVGQLKRAKNPVETELAEGAVEKGMGRLRDLVDRGGLPPAEAEAANTILSAVKRMEKSLAERPSAKPEIRERLAAEMKDAFVVQDRLMKLTRTTEGLTRLPAEARRARMMLESKIENLERSMAEAEASVKPGAARRATLLNEQLEYARIEKTLIERFDGVNPSARLLRVDEHIASIRSGRTPSDRLTVNPKLSRLVRESLEVEALLEPLGAKDAGAMKAYRAETRRALELDGSIADMKGQIKAAERKQQPTEGFEARLKDLSAKRDVSMGELGKLETTLGMEGSGKLAKLTRQALTLEGRLVERELEVTRAAIKDAKAAKQPTEALEARLIELASNREAAIGEIRALKTRTGEVKSTPKLKELIREKEALEAGLPPERLAAHREYEALLEREQALSTKMGEADAGSRAAIESERATVRGSLRRIELDLSAAPHSYMVGKVRRVDLGGALRRIETLSSEAGRLEGRITAAESKGESTRDLKANLKSARKEEAALRAEARTEIIRRFDDVGAEIVKLTREGLPGWEAQVNRMLERRRALQEAYAGDESAMYTAYREMKETARPIGTDPRLMQKPYVIPGGEGMEPAAVFKRADYLIDRAREVETKPRRGGTGPLEAELLKAKAELEALSATPKSNEYFEAYDRLLGLEKEVLSADSFHAAGRHLKTINGDTLGFLASTKLLFQALTGKLPSAPAPGMGLTRYHAAKMLEGLSKDPMMPAHQRDNLMWSYLNSLFLPKGLTGRGSYVRSEIINMVQGFNDSAAGVRVDNRTGRFNVVHNGQWFESMDNASRRWWELEYGTDLTLPYTHNSMSTIKDVTTNKKAYFISLSGTSGNKFEAHLRDNKISVVGEGSAMPKNVLLEVVGTPEQRLARVVKSLDTLAAATRDRAVLRAETDLIPVEKRQGAEIEWMGNIDKYMAANGMKRSDPQVIKISDVPGAQAQAFLHGIRASQKNTGLIVLSVSDTRALRKVEAELKKAGVEQNEIAKVFADTEYLRANVFEASVLKQMNIEGLNTGKVKVLILDTRVGGRGLDLNFKGERSSRADAFRGYTNFEMLVLGPEEMSAVHMVQAMGRIDTGRTLNKAPRQFSLLMDVATARAETVFKNMFETDPFFVKLRKDPAFQDYVRANGGKIDWNTGNNYLQQRGRDGTGEGELLAQQGEAAVRKGLAKRNLEVEENLLVQSQVLAGQATTVSKHPALESIR